jgi:hypothetical protein
VGSSGGGIEATKEEVCRNTKGTCISIYYQGLDRADESIRKLPESTWWSSNGTTREKNVSWVSLFINSLAPMLVSWVQ